MKVLTATEVARNFASVLDQVERGETIIVTRGGRQVATISAEPTGTGRALVEFLKANPPHPDFERDVRSAREILIDQEREWPDGD